MRRYDRELSLEIDRTVRRFNAKIKRLEREQRDLELPTPIIRADIIKPTSSKATIQKKLKEYQRFLERGAEETITTEGGVRLSRYELNRLKSKQRSAKISLTKEIKRLQQTQPRVAGVKQAGTFASMGDFQYTSLLATRKALNKNIEKLSPKQFETHKAHIEKAISTKDNDLVLKQNYMEMLDKLGYTFGVDKRQVDYIKNKLNKLSPSDFVRLFNEDQAVKTMAEYYAETMTVLKGKSSLSVVEIGRSAEDLFDLLADNIEEIIEDYE